MKFSNVLLPAALIGVAAITSFGTPYLFVRPQIALASRTDQRVSKIAEAITVIIFGPQNTVGSGVIIKHQGDTYTILTCWHVVDEAGTYIIQTPDKVLHRVNSSRAKHLEGVDLAHLEFTSKEKYNVAQLGNSDAAIVGTTIYVAGAPAADKLHILLVLPGNVIAVRSQQDARQDDGYALVYNNATHNGMSGGPVFDENGLLIGIHGRGTSDASDTRVPLPYKQGIPINTYRPPPPSPHPTPPRDDDPYAYLRDDLAAGNWLEADADTQAIMLKLANEQDSRIIHEASISNLPCPALSKIDKLWADNSDGRFGFSVQKNIWLSVGGQPGNPDDRIYDRFGDKLRWRFRGSWIPYDDLTVPQNNPQNAPSGYLPRRFLDGPIWGNFFGQMKKCNL